MAEKSTRNSNAQKPTCCQQNVTRCGEGIKRFLISQFCWCAEFSGVNSHHLRLGASVRLWRCGLVFLLPNFESLQRNACWFRVSVRCFRRRRVPRNLSMTLRADRGSFHVFSSDSGIARTQWSSLKVMSPTSSDPLRFINMIIRTFDSFLLLNICCICCIFFCSECSARSFNWRRQ